MNNMRYKRKLTGSGNRFDLSKLKGMPGKIWKWLESKHISPRMLFVIMGAVSTIWFLIRVIPKPTRATYPV
jgi:hypothetical protein